MNIEQLVDKELKGSTSEEELQHLHGNPEEWRRVLSDKVRDIDLQLTKRHQENVPGTPAQVRSEYNKWRGSAVAYKNVLVGKLSEIKSIIKYRNVIAKEVEENILSSILFELREIKKLLTK